jgi:D-inositol-3-phosphate glycosyltransferase
VTFAGRIEQCDLPLYYSSANVLVVPSYYESFGLVALESLACGTPVVATPVGAMDTIIHEKQTGRVITDHTPRSLASGIEEFFSRGKARVLLPEAIRSSVLKFSWSQVADQMLDEYFSVIEGQKNKAAPSDVPRCLANPH